MEYTLYNDDTPAARFTVKNGLVSGYSCLVPELLPMQIRNASADRFTLWLHERAIDLNVLQHRNLAQQLYGTRDKLNLALMTHMFSLTDTFTCFPDGEFVPRGALCSPDGQNLISQYILLSSDTSVNNAHISTPNMSTDGSFTKTWVSENGVWWLYKLQSRDATRGEVFISRALRGCKWDAAEYAFAAPYQKRVKSRNFLWEHEFFEPYDSLRYMFDSPDDDDETIMSNLSLLGETFRRDWKRILLADALFLNTDRHTRNFGVIRSSVTGDILRLAPNFDNNQAYRANPSGKYSDSMLKAYMRTADSEDKKNLTALTESASSIPYLKDAVDSARSYI